MLDSTKLTIVGLEEILVGDKFKTIDETFDIKEGSIIEVIEKVENKNSFICKVNGEIYHMPIHETFFSNKIFVR